MRRLKITKPKIFCTADPVLALHSVPLTFGKKILYNHNVTFDSTPKIGVAVRHWIDWDKCRNEIAAALDKLAEKISAQIVFIPMHFPEDIKAAKSIVQLMKSPCTVIEEELLTAESLSVIGCMDVLISIRLHALIFAGVMGIPMLGISYDPKIERFLDSINEKPLGKLQDITADKIFAETVKRLDAGKNFRNESRFANLRELSLKNAKLAFELLSSE